MKNSIIILIVILTFTSCSNKKEKQKASEKAEIQKVNKEKDYPWTTDVTESAIKAIHKSILNVAKPENQREKNFPANLNNMEFNLTKIDEFSIVGYSTTADQSDIYKIDFQLTDKITSGPRITVEINIKTKEPLRVYMSPDA